jgi:nitrite reductase/ring-hydroxylating ferredoxin subunit
VSEHATASVRVHPDARRLGEGHGVRFSIVLEGVSREAFAIRFRGAIHGYVNQCRHENLQLDFGDARFFDDAFDALVCCHHGARYAPESGLCTEGPCRGARLTRLQFEQRGGELWCVGADSNSDASRR